jgi:FtsP/CotA-like multicopper oxidase with cupredoxin domain
MPSDRGRVPPGLIRHRRLLVAVVATAVLLGPLGYLWASSLLPGTYSVMDMGYPDYGGGSQPGDQQAPAGSATMPGMEHGITERASTTGGPTPSEGSSAVPNTGRSVDSLTADPGRAADLAITLTARKETFTLADGRPVSGYTLNGTSPGPEIRAVQGQLLQVRLVNESVPDGITLHWHGVDVPNAEDGVAGVTQNAVPVGGEFVYRFVLEQAGTFWYHSHQVSHDQVLGGLLGALVVTPAGQQGLSRIADVDQSALVHLYDGRRTVNGVDQDLAVPANAADRVRVRVINTDNGPMSVWVVGGPYRLVAVDGTDLVDPGAVTDQSVLLTAGGRADLEIDIPADGSRVRVVLGGSNSLILGPSAGPAPTAGRPPRTLDLLSYGSPAPITADRLDPAAADRSFEYSIGRRPGLVNRIPGFYWTINGHLFPDVPMFVVSDGDLVVMHIANNSGEVHPMHLHGHHALVVSRDGVAATGSPWWVDSLNVADGESYDIVFRADNPGIWMDHCHNLPHATDGLVAHLMYQGVTEPFQVGSATDNQPE